MVPVAVPVGPTFVPVPVAVAVAVAGEPPVVVVTVREIQGEKKFQPVVKQKKDFKGSRFLLPLLSVQQRVGLDFHSTWSLGKDVREVQKAHECNDQRPL